MQYELKNIKTLNTSNGIAWTASVYKDGKRIGSAEDRGDGGSSSLYITTYAEEQALVEWARTAVQGSGLWMEEFSTMPIDIHHVGGAVTQGYRFDTELALAYLMEIADLDKKSKKNLVFRVAKTSTDGALDNYDIYIARHFDNRDKSVLYVSQKYPTAQIWDVDAHAWTSVLASVKVGA